MTKKKFEDILYEKADGIAWITINRPEKYNGFRTKTIEEMTSAVKDADRDPCSGADVDEFAKEIFPNPAKARIYLEKFIGLRDAITGAGKPVIAAVNGYCIAGGHEIHLWCDITIASENARLGQGGVKVGSAPIFGGSQLFAKNVGEKRARYQMYKKRRRKTGEIPNVHR
jgi:enoyl-CoA hydratase/carnithine racemase